MATRVYATQAEYEAYTGGAAPANVQALLRAASRVVDVLLTAVVYDTDTDGYPTDTAAAEALSDATCAIAAECASTGALEAGGTQAWDSVGIGNVSLSGRGTSDDAVVVLGIAVPAVALLSLRDVGPLVVIQQ